jgi:hypothetical protein
MDTLFDFTTKVKGVEYLIAISAIVRFILFLEILKNKPFKSLRDIVRDELRYVKEHGLSPARLLTALFRGIIYVISLPFAFFLGIGTVLINSLSKAAGGSSVFSWRPMEAYFSGRKKNKKQVTSANQQTGTNKSLQREEHPTEGGIAK